jgi:hypothetical protein
MLSMLRRLTGLIDTQEQGDFIHISGLPGDMVAKDIMSVFQTSKIANNIFSNIGTSDVSFHRWFAPDIVTVFNRILATEDSKYHLRAMRKVIEQLMERTWLANTLKDYPDILDTSRIKDMKVTLFDYQDEFIALYNHNVPRYGLTGYLLGAPPGSGKTILGLATQRARMRQTVVVCCPKNAVVDVWEKTICNVFKKQPSYWTSLQGCMPPKGLNYYICHYDAFEKFMAATRGFSFRETGVLLDESHKLNEFDTGRTQLFIKMCVDHLQSQDTIWASGTPIKAVGAEATPIFTTIDPMFNNPDLQQRFRAIYTKTAYKANEILNARLGKVHFTIARERFRSDKPHFKDEFVKIPNAKEYTLPAIREELRAFMEERKAYYEKNMSAYKKAYYEVLARFEEDIEGDEDLERQLAQYQKWIKLISKTDQLSEIKEQIQWCNKFEKTVIIPRLSKEDKDTFKDTRSVVKYYTLKVQGEALGKIVGGKRARCIVDMVPYMNLPKIIDHSLSKTLIFTSYVEVIRTANAYLKHEGYEPLMVFGETNSELPAMVKKFGSDENANPMIATYKSLAEAVPITMASTLITLNSPFRDYELSQAIARVDRIGQPNPVTVVHCYLDTDGEPNISTRSKDILEWSKEQVQQIMGVDLEDGVVMEAFQQTAFEAYQSTGYAGLIDWSDLTMESWETAFLPKRKETPLLLNGW